MADPLISGQRVEQLSAICRSAGFFAGLACTGVATWWIKRGWATVTVAAIVGAIAGVLIASVVGRLLYERAGNTHVTHLGAASLKATVPAALISSLVVAVVVFAVSAIAPAARENIVPLGLTVTAAAITSAVLSACLGSLL